MKSERTALAGWGGTAPSVATVIDVRPDELDDADALLSQIGPRGAIARGLGRSYGDPAQNGGGTVIRLQPGADPIRLDADAGTVTVDAGVSLDDLLRVIIPQGWFVPVTPGTRFVTVGGAIASDIHGKNHHVDGTFGAHVSELELLLADGSVRRRSRPASDPDLFWATVGGMGLTGLILRATFDLIPIETQHILVVNERVPNFDALLERMVADDHLYRYSVAWIDLIASGRHLGRAVLGRGNHATLDDLLPAHPRSAANPLGFDPPVFPDVPPGVPNVLHRHAVRGFNEVWYRKTPQMHRGNRDAHRLLPPARHRRTVEPAVRAAAASCSTSSSCRSARSRRCAPSWPRSPRGGDAGFLTVLKRFGAESGGMLSFPQPGWTLTVDLPASPARLAGLLEDSIGSCSTPVGGTTSPRTPPPVRPSSAPATRDSTSGRRSARGSIPTVAGRATRPRRLELI